MADVVLVCAITDKTAKKKSNGMSIFLVDTDLPGFKKGRLLKKIGRPAADTAELFFEDMRLPKSALLSEEKGLNRGFQVHRPANTIRMARNQNFRIFFIFYSSFIISI